MSYRALSEYMLSALAQFDHTASIPTALSEGDYIGALLMKLTRLVELAPLDARYYDGNVTADYYKDTIAPALRRWVLEHVP